jgi:hypothetical protein
MQLGSVADADGIDAKDISLQHEGSLIQHPGPTIGLMAS